MSSDAAKPTPPLVVDRLEAARLLGGVHPNTVDNLRNRGLLPCVRIGRRVLFSLSAIVEYIAKQEQANAG